MSYPPEYNLIFFPSLKHFGIDLNLSPYQFFAIHAQGPILSQEQNLHLVQSFPPKGCSLDLICGAKIHYRNFKIWPPTEEYEDLFDTMVYIVMNQNEGSICWWVEYLGLQELDIQNRRHLLDKQEADFLMMNREVITIIHAPSRDLAYITGNSN